MGASSESNMMSKLIKFGCISTFILIFITSLGRYLVDTQDRTRCSSLLNEGWWTDRSMTSWQPASCMMHTYKAPDMNHCLSHARVVYVGDSIAREQFFAAVRLVRPSMDTSGEAHINRKFVMDGLTMEFWWDPYLNQTSLIHQSRPSLLVVGTGAWQMHYLGNRYYEEWKRVVDNVFETASRQPLADAVLMSPVEWPDYDRLSQNRSVTMTMEKINKMNQYLQLKESQLESATPFAVPFVWNKVSAEAPLEATEDGLHFNSAVTTVQAQIALNYRCNNQLDKKFPMGSTCCYTYPSPRWYQLFFMGLFLIWAPLGFLIKNSSVSTTLLSNKLFPAQKILNAVFIFGLCVIYMYFSDRTQLFGKIQKNFNPTVFTMMMIAVAVLGMVKLEHKKEGDQGFLNRHQTDEWKGWMQVIILVYHFCGASGTSGIYNAVRILVAAYLFQTGYGHFFYFYKKADFGMGRVLNVMVRLNFLTFVLQYLMDTDYLSYYFTPLVSFWFLVIWLVMYVGHGYNKVPYFMLLKLILSCCLTTAFIHVPGVLEAVFRVLETLANVHWNAAEWRFRLALDAYIVYVGMLCAYLFIKLTEHKLTEHPRWSIVKQLSIALSAIAMVWYFWFELTRENKFVYNTVHPFISWIPILAFVILRNMNLYLRNTHSHLFAFIGKISLETFIGQFHMWLAGDTKGLLVILSPPTWVAGLGWWVNLMISSCLFIFVCHYMSQTTHEISVWICKHAQPSSDSNADRSQARDYQAVPLLPTTQTEPNQQQNEEEEEIWDSSLVNEKKPNWIKQLLDDTRVKSLLFLLLMSIVNHFC